MTPPTPPEASPRWSVRPYDDARFDLVSLGEVMLRLDPGEGRIHTARSFNATEGGGEYNVARGLRRCFGLRTAIVTALVDNAVGRLVEDLLLTGGVDLSYLNWATDDGVGRRARNGLNFTERGFGPRAAMGCSDRGHTAISQLSASDVDFRGLFRSGVRVFHTGGIFAGLSEISAETAEVAMREAKAAGARVSYDLNYRPSLWEAHGGKARAQLVNRALMHHVDILFGNEEDFTAALGFEVEDAEGKSVDLRTKAADELPLAAFRRMIDKVRATYPNLTTVATTLRTATSATENRWGAVCFHQGKFYETAQEVVTILDRVGGGDSFASGFLYGLLTGESAEFALRCGVSHGALAMATPGDTSMARKDEVLRHMAGQSARIQR